MEPVWTPSSTGYERPFSSSPERVGRDGFLGLRFACRSGKTALMQCRFRLPLQVLAPAELPDGTACLMLLNPTGGIVGGDSLSIQIVQEEGTRVCLTTPSATRVYRTLDRPASQNTILMVGEDASVEYLPDHVIPYSGSDFRQSLHVEMAAGSAGIFWDALAAGRVARGECWEFRELDFRTEIYMRGRGVFLNRIRIRPGVADPRQLGVTDGFSYVAMLLVLADRLTDWNEVVATMTADIARVPEVCAGVSALTSSGCVVKVLAHTASDMARAQATLWRCARRMVLGSGAVDLRKY